MQKKSRTDKLLYQLKNNKLVAITIIAGTIIIAILTFYDKIEPILIRVFNNNRSSKAKEYEAIDYIRDKYQADTLRVHQLLHVFVSRRDYEMHFFIPNTWDYEEPLDGPAGLRYKTYFLPQNPACIINASAEIVCLENLIDKNDSINKKLGEQTQILKTLSGLDPNSPDIGYCNIDDYVDYRIKNAKNDSEEFKLLYNSPALKLYVEKEKNYYPIEGRRIKFSFKYNGQDYFVTELITYIDNIAFILYFGAPESYFVKLENIFINISNNCYIRHI